MLTVSHSALRQGCERAHDLFHLNRLNGPDAAAQRFDAVFDALGFDVEMRAELERALIGMLPIRGVPIMEASMAMSSCRACSSVCSSR